MSKTLCKIRDLQKALDAYAAAYEAAHGLSLKEGMLLCCIAESERTASEIALATELSSSNCSKIIASAERKELLRRSLGASDKRNMFFGLTEEGKRILGNINANPLEVPDVIRKIIE